MGRETRIVLELGACGRGRNANRRPEVGRAANGDTQEDRRSHRGVHLLFAPRSPQPSEIGAGWMRRSTRGGAGRWESVLGVVRSAGEAIVLRLASRVESERSVRGPTRRKQEAATTSAVLVSTGFAQRHTRTLQGVFGYVRDRDTRSLWDSFARRCGVFASRQTLSRLLAAELQER